MSTDVFLNTIADWQEPESAKLLELERSIGLELPECLHRLYELSGGSASRPSDGQRRLPVRLMPLDEVAELYGATADLFGRAIGTDVLCVFSDDDGNYVACFLSGEHFGKLCRVRHDNWNPVPVWPDIVSFLRCIMRRGDSVATVPDAP